MTQSYVYQRTLIGAHQPSGIGRTLSGCRFRFSSHPQPSLLLQCGAVKSRPSTSAASSTVPACTRGLSSPSAARVKKQALDRDVIVSVLEAAATRRDAKGYLQKYAAPAVKKPTGSPLFIQDQNQPQETVATEEEPHVAILTLRAPQKLTPATIDGIAKTISQLRILGLLSTVVIDCGATESRKTFEEQGLRLCEAIDSFGKPGSKLVSNIFIHNATKNCASRSLLDDDIRVDDRGSLERAIQNGMITVVPSLASMDVISPPEPADLRKTALALTRYFTGLQFPTPNHDFWSNHDKQAQPRKIATVERLILLDPLGGTPDDRSGICHRFINLEQEYEVLLKDLAKRSDSIQAMDQLGASHATTHAANLGLAKDTLSLLPRTSSALITTPEAAANTGSAAFEPSPTEAERSHFRFNDMVTTRRRQNPLLHNLLTDRPVFSSSLPFQRIKDDSYIRLQAGEPAAATLVKRGIPLTIYPDPRVHPWQQPKLGSPTLQLTDNCIDLPRLIHLIEDSFDREIDVQDYLNRVKSNLAGVIIAGDYEGGAILTWEQPNCKANDDAIKTNRFVPYLDKFAVLKSRQGSGGVADIVFNAMVQDCFPQGVCWRSRKNNPVNKWYFERSLGACKLTDSNWTMFWTTPGLYSQHQKLRDYESVCRQVQPSWTDKKKSPD